MKSTPSARLRITTKKKVPLCREEKRKTTDMERERDIKIKREKKENGMNTAVDLITIL